MGRFKAIKTSALILLLLSVGISAGANPLNIPARVNIQVTLQKNDSPPATLLSFYRQVIGRFDGARGNGYPVTSLYAKQALNKHGPVIGTWLTVDRLLRDWREISHPYTTIYADERLRYVDPLQRNDFWLEK